MANYIDAVNGAHGSGEDLASLYNPNNIPQELATVFARTDWRLLARQKARLIDLKLTNPGDLAAVDGILNWISAVQDALVDSGAWEEEVVFPEQ